MEIQENILLSKYTILKIGGPAKYFIEAKNEEEILEAVKFAEEKKLPTFVLGGGSNVLVSDKGFDGVVIRLCNSQFVIRNLDIICDGGCQLGKIVNESVKAGLIGLKWAAGIPGTIGGAVRGNAGAFGGEMADAVKSVNVVEMYKTTKIQSARQNTKHKTQNTNLLRVTCYVLRDCQFAYRDSVFKQNPNLIILSVTLKLRKGDRTKSEKKIKEILAKRKNNQPEFPSPGSFFKNPCLAGRQAETRSQKLLEEFEKDTGDKAKKNIIPAGYLIDRLGMRGKRIGGAIVSRAHGNFLVNAGGATAENFIILAAIVKTRVRNKFGIQLKEEVQMVGF